MASAISDLDWVRDGVDSGESAVVQNLLYLAAVSRQAASRIVDLDWMKESPHEAEARAVYWLSGIEEADVVLVVVDYEWVWDGVEGAEVTALEYLTYTSSLDPRAGLAVASLGWMADGIGDAEVNAIRNLNTIASEDPEALVSLVSLPWVLDGLTGLEFDAVEWISNVRDGEAVSSVVTLGWIQDGIEEPEVEAVEYLSYVVNLDVEAGLALLSLDWITDGIDDVEASALENFASVGREDPDAMETLVSLPWMLDGLTDLEAGAVEWIGNFSDGEAVSSVVALGWIQDGIEEPEVEAVEYLSYVANLAPRAGLAVVSLGWIVDGVGDVEVSAIENFASVADVDPDALEALVSLPWMLDDLTDLEADAVEWIGNFSSGEIVSSVVALGWFQDGIEEPEVEAVEYLSYVANLDVEAGLALLSIGWIAEGIGDEEAIAILSLYSVAYEDPDAMVTLVSLPWMLDGVTDLEAEAVGWIGNIQSGEVASSLIALDWVEDGISPVEAQMLQEISYLSFDHPEETMLVLEMPFLEVVDPPDVTAMAALAGLANFMPQAFSTVMSRPEIRAGITDEMAPVVSTLHGVAEYNPDLIPVLLDPEKVALEQRTIELPLSGEVVLSIIRTRPGAARSMDLLEESVRAVEEYMEFPLTTNHIGLLYEDAVISGYAGVNFGTHMALLPEYDVDDGSYEAEFTAGITTHEVAHYYWVGNEHWVDEGAAEFIAAVAAGTLAEHPADAFNAPCRLARTIAELESLDADTDDAAFLCNYTLGARLFLDLHRSLGESTFRQSLRRLYALSQAEDEADDLPGTSVGVGHVRRAFGPGGETANAVIARWYEGVGPYDLSVLDDGPILASLPGMDGRVESAHVSLTQDGPAVSSVALDDITDWMYLTVEFSYRVSGSPHTMPFEVVESFEDGFVFGRTETELVAMPQFGGETQWIAVGPPPGEGLDGRYTIQVFAGDRKIAEVKYEVTK